MKRFFVVLSSCIFLAACSGGSEEKKEEPKVADITQDPAYQNGLQLEAQQDCKTCHTLDAKITGPSYREIADKYAAYPDTIVTHLAKKVRDGGTGVWGEIAMLPHPSISQDTAEAIVKYILLLKTPKQ